MIRASLLLSASTGSLLAAQPAFAQTAGQAVPQSPPADQVPPAADQQQANQTPPGGNPANNGGDTGATEDSRAIVVTGTRIRQPEFTSPDPVSRIDPVIAQREGKLSTAETLQSSPIAAGSTQITSALSSNFVTNGGPGSQTIDLRGLGPNRTLVLLNGRRAGPAGTRGGVSSFDLNVLPQSIVKQVDILKTGASSIYGSDAVAGVVNLITKTDFEGVQVDGFVNAPQHLGGEQFDVSVLWGKKFGHDRGHIMVAVDAFHQNELARKDRKYLDCPEAYIFNKSGKRADLIDPRTGKYHCEDLPVGQVWTYDQEYLYGYGAGNLHLADGTYVGPVNLMQFQYPGEHLGVPPISGCGDVPGNCFGTPPGWFPTGYDPASSAIQNDYNPFAGEQTIIPKTSRYTVYADGSYKFSDAIEMYGEFLANRRSTYQNGWRQIWTFGGTSDYYPTYWAPGWTGQNLLSPTALTNHADSSQRVDYWRGVGGIRGDLGGFLKGWSYDAYVQYSHNKGIYKTEQFLQDIYDVSFFQSASCVGTNLSRSGKACMDVPWTDPYFLLGQESAELADYLFDWEKGKTIYTQLSGEASITGSLFQLPGGPVGLAFGISGRRDALNDVPGEITQAGNAWGNTTAGVSKGHSVSTEAYGELQVPLIREHPFFRDLSLNAAARITSVKTTRASDNFSDSDNGNWTYKLGANWAVNNWLRFRGTYGTSFRSPALFEQVKSLETSFPSGRTIDPCVNWQFNLDQGNIDQRIADNCASQGIPGTFGGASITPTSFSIGGLGELDPETSKAWTASVILTPRFSFLPRTRVSLAIDYFNIKVKNEVTQLGPRNIIFGCYDSPDFPTDPLCSLFERGTTGNPFAITTITDRYVNIANQKNSGVDFTLVVQQNLGRLGSLTLTGNATRQIKDSIVLLPGSPAVINNGNIGDPKFVADLNASWRPGNGWTFFWGTEWYGKASNNRLYEERNGGSLCNDDNPSPIWGVYCERLTVPNVFYHAASITKEFPKSGLELTFGVRNIFDTRPPRVSTIGGSGLPSLIGPVVGTSQYDFQGRRAFLNFSKKF
ncbi:iron complex outermembrane recepter protein [Sphingomonas sp. F9_3S_D5_B_2]